MPRSKRVLSVRRPFTEMRIKIASAVVMIAVGLVVSNAAQDKTKPTLFIIGDSTVNNTDQGVQGWGNVIGDYFDQTKINVINRARGGRSSRTFYTEGLWDKVLADMKAGD